MEYILFKFLLAFIIICSCWLYVDNIDIKNYEKRELMRKVSKYLDKENERKK